MSASDHVLHEVKGLKKSFDNMTKLAIMSYAELPIFDVQATPQYTELFTSTESLSGTIALAESETPPTNKLNEGYSVTLTDQRYGNSILITETDQRKIKDGTILVDTYLTRQRNALLRDIRNKFITDLHSVYNDAFAGATYTAPDSVALCGTHSWNTTGASTWDNGVTAALSATAVDAAMAFGGAFTDASGKPMPQTYDTIIVKLGGTASREAKKLFAHGIKPTAVNDVNIYEGEFRIVETPYLTSTTAWFMMDTKQMDAPVYSGIGKMPSMREPQVLENESIRTNVTGYWKLGINNMPINLYGSDGTV